METVQAKENILSSLDEGSVVSGKMSGVTPRRPLVDLKQVSRPSTVAVGTERTKCHTPLLTPQIQKPKRGWRQSNVIYRDTAATDDVIRDCPPVGDLQTNGACSGDGQTNGPTLNGDCTDGDIGSFVDAVIQECVHDVMPEHMSINDDACHVNQQQSKPQSETIASPTCSTDTNTQKTVTFIENPSNVATDCERYVDADLSSCTEVFQTPNVSLRGEEILLGDVSIYSDCPEHLDVSSCEDRLLAETPGSEANQAPLTVEGTDDLSGEDEVAAPILSPLHQAVDPPRATFLTRIAVMERVRTATSTMSDWVHPRDHAHLPPLHIGTQDRLLYDMACSPIVFDEVVDQQKDSNASVKRAHSVACSPVVFDEFVNKHKDAGDVSADAVKQAESVACSPIMFNEKDVCSNGDLTDVRQTCERNTPPGETDSHGDDTEAIMSREKTYNAAVIQVTNDFCCQTGEMPVRDCQDQTMITEFTPISHTACSPILAIQRTTPKKIEMQSIMCSPIPISVQHTYSETDPTNVQDRSMITDSSTPVKHSAMCSPMTRQPLCDVSIDNVPTMETVQCSPIVPYSTRDRSMVTVTAGVCDACVGTTEVEGVEVAVDARPDTRTVHTDMDESPLCSVATSMTPFKVNHKHGKHTVRVTAEDVRKQHPRAVANEMDTLRLQADRLSTQLHGIEGDRDKLASAARDSRTAQTLSQTHLAEVTDLLEEDKNKLWTMTNRCAELETQLLDQASNHKADTAELEHKLAFGDAHQAALITEHANEIQQLKDEFERTDYRPHFDASQKLVCQLQTELAQYTELLDDIEQSQSLQGDLEKALSSSYMKVKATGDKIVVMKVDLAAKECELTQRLAEINLDAARLAQDRSTLVSERDDMELSMMVVQQSMHQMEERYQSAVEELTSVTADVTEFSSELTRVHKAFEEANEEKCELERQVGELRAAERAAFVETEGLQAALTVHQKGLADTTQRLKALQDVHEKEIQRSKTSAEKAELELINVQRTLDMREQDIDMHEKDLFECRETIYLQMERITRHEKDDKSRFSELTTLRAENSQLKDCCARLRGEEQDLRKCDKYSELQISETLKYTREELSSTKEHASRLLKEQGTELANCSTAIGQLMDHITSVLTNLNKKAGILHQSADGNPEASSVALKTSIIHDQSQHPQKSQKPPQSLVSLILTAAETQDEITEHEAINRTLGNPAAKNSSNSQTGSSDLSENGEKTECSASVNSAGVTVMETTQMVDSPGTQSRKSLGFTGNSAFAPVTASHPSKVIDTNSSSGVTKNQSRVVDVGDENKSENGDNDSILTQVSRMSDMFTEVIRVANLIEKAAKSSLQDTRSENMELSSRVSQHGYSEHNLVAELEVKSRELGASRAAITDLRARLDDLSDRLGNCAELEAETKRLQMEVRSMHGKHASIEAENQLLNEQIAELLKRMETTPATPGVKPNDPWLDARSQKEILTLQKKVQRLREQLQEKQDFVEEISNKATRRIQKLEANWKKADSEVYRFDELVDAVRGCLVNQEFALRDNDEIKRIVRLIDGVEPLSTFKTGKSGDLKPMKTSKW